MSGRFEWTRRGAWIVALGCSGEAARPDSSALDATAEALADGAVAGDTSDQDAAHDPDARVLPDADVVHDAAVVELPGAPEAAPVVVEWALQTTPGTQGLVGARAVGLADGSVLASSVFAGSVTIGETVLTANEDRYVHYLAVRIGPAGDIRFARHLCDGCAGAVAEAADGRLLFAGFGQTVIGDPKGPTPIDVSAAANGPVVTRTTSDGAIDAMVRIGQGGGEFTAVAARPGGGWVLGGSAFDLEFADGTRVMPEDAGWPGRAFLVWLDDALAVERVEPLGGTAGSAIAMLAADGDGVVAVGDFGGYPNGETLSFGEPPAFVLESASSDDDPALDLFVARWSAPAQVAFARRVQHYSNGTRPPTWIRASADGVMLRLDDCAALDVKDGELFCGYGDSGASLGLRFGPGGEWVDEQALLYRAEPWPDQPHFVVARATWQPTDTLGSGADALTFTLPASDETTAYTGLLLAHARPDGALARGGLLPLAGPVGTTPLTLLKAVPQPDGSVVVVLHGSPTVVLDPLGSSPRELKNTGYERLVVLRVRFDGSEGAILQPK